MIYTYPAIFMKYKKDGSYIIYFPDLNQTTNGVDLNDSIYMATDLLAIVLSSMIEDEEKIPVPSQINKINPREFIDEIRNDFTNEEKEENEISEYFVNYVSVNPEEYARKHITKYDKKTLTIPHWLNVKAQQRGINFSKTLTDALIAILKV